MRLEKEDRRQETEYRRLEARDWLRRYCPWFWETRLKADN
jgi:hypothetical protein